MSAKYVTHQFAHPETLDRAARWLRHLGVAPDRIETHRDGIPWISVIASHGQSAEIEMIFKAAERSDPDGWPSFWHLARMPHPHVEPTADDPLIATTIVTTRPLPIGWHPPDVADTTHGVIDHAEVWDITTRFGSGTPPKFIGR